MTAMTQRQVLVTMPNVDWDFFATLAEKFHWETTLSTQAKTATISKSMQRALDDEKEGRITKLVNHKNAVAEILG